MTWGKTVNHINKLQSKSLKKKLYISTSLAEAVNSWVSFAAFFWYLQERKKFKPHFSQIYNKKIKNKKKQAITTTRIWNTFMWMPLHLKINIFYEVVGHLVVLKPQNQLFPYPCKASDLKFQLIIGLQEILISNVIDSFLARHPLHSLILTNKLKSDFILAWQSNI
jgi:hypothetical protein